MVKDLKAQVQWEEIDALLDSLSVSPWDKDDLKQMVLDASFKWLDEDLALGRIEFVEEKWRATKYANGLVLPIPMAGTADLILKGGKRVIDWKTAGTLDQEWATKMRLSWQWKIYLWRYPDAEEFCYRGIKRDGSTRVVELKRYPSLEAEVDLYLAGVQAQFNGLHDQRSALPIWPRKQPGACKAFGRPCPYLEGCWNDGGSDPGAAKVDELHYTTTELLLLCPERFRRGSRVGGDAEGSAATRFGTHFHTLMAAIYRQFAEPENLLNFS